MIIYTNPPFFYTKRVKKGFGIKKYGFCTI